MFYLLVGERATGKSEFVRNLGFKICTDYSDVIYQLLKGENNLIIEDFHESDSSKFTSLIEYIWCHNKNNLIRSPFYMLQEDKMPKNINLYIVVNNIDAVPKNILFKCKPIYFKKEEWYDEKIN